MSNAGVMRALHTFLFFAIIAAPIPGAGSDIATVSIPAARNLQQRHTLLESAPPVTEEIGVSLADAPPFQGGRGSQVGKGLMQGSMSLIDAASSPEGGRARQNARGLMQGGRILNAGAGTGAGRSYRMLVMVMCFLLFVVGARSGRQNSEGDAASQVSVLGFQRSTSVERVTVSLKDELEGDQPHDVVSLLQETALAARPPDINNVITGEGSLLGLQRSTKLQKAEILLSEEETVGTASSDTPSTKSDKVQGGGSGLGHQRSMKLPTKAAVFTDDVADDRPKDVPPALLQETSAAASSETSSAETGKSQGRGNGLGHQQSMKLQKKAAVVTDDVADDGRKDVPPALLQETSVAASSETSVAKTGKSQGSGSALGLQRSMKLHKKVAAVSVDVADDRPKDVQPAALLQETFAASLSETSSAEIGKSQGSGSVLGLQRSMKLQKTSAVVSEDVEDDPPKDVPPALLQETSAAASYETSSAKTVQTQESGSVLGLQRSVTVQKKAAVVSEDVTDDRPKEVSPALLQETSAAASSETSSANTAEPKGGGGAFGPQRSMKLQKKAIVVSDEGAGAKPKATPPVALLQEQSVAASSDTSSATIGKPQGGGSALGLQRSMKLQKKAAVPSEKIANDSPQEPVALLQVSSVAGASDKASAKTGKFLGGGFQHSTKLQKKSTVVSDDVVGDQRVENVYGDNLHDASPTSALIEDDMVTAAETDVSVGSVLGLQRGMKLTQNAAVFVESDASDEKGPVSTGGALGFQRSVKSLRAVVAEPEHDAEADAPSPPQEAGTHEAAFQRIAAAIGKYGNEVHRRT